MTMASSSAKSVQDFRTLLDKQTADLTGKCQRWQKVLETFNGNEDVKGQILATTGQTRQLVSDRFGQFRGLVDDCEHERGERKTTVDDLAGFWDMIFIQIEDINGKFAVLDDAEKNGWRLPEVPPVRTGVVAESATKTNGHESATGGEHHHAVVESTDRVKNEAEKSNTVKERRSELRNFIAQQKKEKQQSGAAGEDDDGLFVEIKTAP